MNVTGLTIALAAAVLVGVAFGIYPNLDVTISRWLFDVNVDGYPFALRLSPVLQTLQRLATVLAWFLVAVPVLAIIIKLARPRRNAPISARAAVFLLSAMLLAPGLLTNVILKEHWHRPRPISITEFGGDMKFVPWWSTAGECRHNCSFVSGDVSMAAWTLAPAALAPPAWRILAYGGALAFTAMIALIRMAFGAHFFTDVALATVLTFLVIWLLHGLTYRWPRTRQTDDDVERRLERIGRWLRLSPRPPRTDP